MARSSLIIFIISIILTVQCVFTVTLSAQNLALIAVASSSGGGVGTEGPANINDDRLEPSGYHWITEGTSSWVELRWTTPHPLALMWCDTNSTYAFPPAEIQYWNGSTYVTVGNMSRATNDWTFNFGGVSTTRIRFANFTPGYNPRIFEITVYGPPSTRTPTPTPTGTWYSATPTLTDTLTVTPTLTETNTGVPTLSPTPTGTWYTITPTYSFTITPTSTNTFTPTNTPTPGYCSIYEWRLDTDPGWSREGKWAYGRPAGAGGGIVGSPDPTAGCSGFNVYGYNLLGDYENYIDPPYYLTAGPIDCTLVSATQLTFCRWLGVEGSTFDRASIEVSNNGIDWHVVWENGRTEVDDGSWVSPIYDLSSVADWEPSVWIRWGMGPTDDHEVYCGWNIDDIKICGHYGTPAPTPAWTVPVPTATSTPATTFYDTPTFTYTSPSAPVPVSGSLNLLTGILMSVLFFASVLIRRRKTYLYRSIKTDGDSS